MRARDLIYRTLIIVGVLLTLYLIYRLASLVIVVFVAIVFASTIRPLLERMVQYRIPRGIALALLYLGAAAAIIALIFIAVPPVTSLILEQFENNTVANDLNFALVSMTLAIRRQFEVYVPIMLLPPSLKEVIENADQTVQEQAWPFARGALFYMGQLTIAVVMSVYWLISRQTALRSLLVIVPHTYRHLVRHIWIDTETTLGAYFRGQIFLAVIIGVASYVGLLVLRIPNPLALAVLSGLLEFVPFLGPILAAVPAILMALTVSPLAGVMIALWYAVVQQIEGNYLVPKIMHDSVGLHPMLVLIALLAGVQLNGIIGGLLAIPIAGAIQVIVRHLWNHHYAADAAKDVGVGPADDHENQPAQQTSIVPEVAGQALE